MLSSTSALFSKVARHKAEERIAKKREHLAFRQAVERRSAPERWPALPSQG